MCRGRSLDGLRQLALAAGVELVHPFLDWRLLRCLLRTPPEAHRVGGRRKAVFRAAFGDRLSDEILDQSVGDNSYQSYVEWMLARSDPEESGVCPETQTGIPRQDTPLGEWRRRTVGPLARATRTGGRGDSPTHSVTAEFGLVRFN